MPISHPPLDVRILPLAAAVDMYGEPDPHSAYSLSGHVVVRLSPQVPSALLRSLSIQFEGASELLTSQTGYTPARLCALSKQLVDHKRPLTLSNREASSPSRERAEYHLVFDLALPGWLPASTIFTPEERSANGGIKYTIFASAEFEIIDGSSRRFCGIKTARPTRTLSAIPVTVLINRFHDPPAETAPAFPPTSFTVQASTDNSIPPALLNSIDILATLPEHTDVRAPYLPLSLRIRPSKTLSCPTTVSELTMRVLQHEVHATAPSRSYMRAYPLPSYATAQPPVVPLLNPHKLSHLDDLNFVGPQLNRPENRATLISPDRNLLPGGRPSRFKLKNNGLRLTSSSSSKDWFKMDVPLPLLYAPGHDAKVDRPGPLRPSGESVHLRVEHTLEIVLTVSFALPGRSQLKVADLFFSLPLSFVVTPPPRPPPATSPGSRRKSMQSSISAPWNISSGRPYGSSAALPPYSHLFHSSGERREDWSDGGLPAYTAA